MRWMTPITRAALVASGAVALIAASTPWHATVNVAERAHSIGNPEAEMRLTEFVSYSCSHCADFAVQGEPALQLVYVGQGRLVREVRSVIRNPIDLVATMLVQCGPTDRFIRNHAMFLRSQSDWLPVAERATSAQIARWTISDASAARRNIASDLDFYTLMERRGYDRPTIDRCLADAPLAKRLMDNSAADREEFKVQGTPSFAIDGVLLDDVHSWSALEPVLQSRYEKPETVF